MAHAAKVDAALAETATWFDTPAASLGTGSNNADAGFVEHDWPASAPDLPESDVILQKQIYVRKTRAHLE